MDQKMLSTVAPIPSYLVLSYLVIRFGDLAYSHKLGLLFTSGMYSWFFWLEIALFVVPALMLLNKKMASDRGKLFLASMLLIFAGALYRFDTYLTGYKPAAGWSYWPNLGELLFSACLAATGVAVYIVMIKLFPLVSGVLKQEKIRLW
jgi:Ni/Fe-hydrogenase subunit HybB-like protein